MRFRWSFLVWTAVLALAFFAASRGNAETIPPRPTEYFNDQAGVVDASVAQSLNHTLANFERETSNQLVVAIYPKLLSDSSVEDFTVRTAQAWGVGQKGKNNGAVLFVFVAEHSVRIEVGYGLEPVLTDAISSQIIHELIIPNFRAGDYSTGIKAGVLAMISACRGEYQGTGRTRADTQSHQGIGNANGVVIGFFIIIMLVVGFIKRMTTGVISRNPTRRWNSNASWPSAGGGFWSGGSSGGGSSGGSDSFSGGGGSFGGGGAGGNW